MGGGCCVSNHPIIDFIKDIICSDSCCVGYSSGPSESEQHARKVAEELSEMKEKSEKSSTQTEQKIMDYINRSMDSFMIEIEKINQQDFFGEKLNINIKAIREKNEQLNKQVVGCISTVLNTRLVQTDKELSTILEERDEKKRKENFSAFVEKVKKQALSKLRIEIEKAVKAQSEMVSKEIKTRQKEVDARMEESIKELTEIMEVKEKSESELKKKQVDYMYQSALCDLLLAEVEG
jgi:hypothetical protein